MMDRLNFLIAAENSGAERLAQWLNESSEILVTDSRFFGQFGGMWPGRDGKLEAEQTWDFVVRNQARRISGRFLDLDRASYQEQLMQELMGLMVDFHLRQSQRKLLLEKVCPFPGTARSVFYNIQKYCPESKVIRLVRDGRDVLVHHAFSWLTKDAQGTDRYSYFVERRPDFALQRFFDDHFIQRWADWWSETARLGRKLQKLDEPQPLIRLEDLLQDFESMSAKLAQHLGHELPSLGENKEHRFMPRFKGQRLTSWSHFFVRRDGQIFQEVAGDVLLALGYEQQSDWFEALPKTLDWPVRERPEDALDGLPQV
jgi:hypothetical protein